MDNPSLRFTHSSQQQRFRLLELPPELLEALESDNPPTLYLKSAPNNPPESSGSGSGSGAGANANANEFVNLCTSTSTYALRQVNSSNSTFILKAKSQPEEQQVGNDGNTDARRGTVAAIAQCKSTLELHKPREAELASSFLYQLATEYDKFDAEADSMRDGMEVDDEDRYGADALAAAARTRARLFGDIPVSFPECRHAWVEECGFVHKDYGSGEWLCRLPSAGAKLLVWKKIMEGSVLQGINLEEQFLVDDLWNAMLDEDEPADMAPGPFPRPLFEAVVRRLMDDPSSYTAKDIDSGLIWANLDKDRTILWVGQTYLATLLAVTRHTFLFDWANLLPEKWCGGVDMDKLNWTSYESPEPSTKRFKQISKAKPPAARNGGR